MKIGDKVRVPKYYNLVGRIIHSVDNGKLWIVDMGEGNLLLAEKDLEIIDNFTERIARAERYLESLEIVTDNDFARGYYRGAKDMLEKIKC